MRRSKREIDNGYHDHIRTPMLQVGESLPHENEAGMLASTLDDDFLVSLSKTAVDRDGAKQAFVEY